MNFSEIAAANMQKLRENSYPGRGIVTGMSADSKYYIQVYWIMGRSENSRNRVFEEKDGFVRTKAYDESKLKDPSLIIYYPLKFYGKSHIISNGDQTDTIMDSLQSGESFEDAIGKREFEPDAPNYTPRISGIIDLDSRNAYTLSILKSCFNDPNYLIRNVFNYEKAIPGFGHCIHTYDGDGDPLPSFSGEPYIVKLTGSIDDTANTFWDLLNEENRVSLLVKFIDAKTGDSEIKIINKYK